jgi:hypothetical protein
MDVEVKVVFWLKHLVETNLQLEWLLSVHCRVWLFG